jgi:hypothetical protein
VELTSEDLDQIESALAGISVQGDRYSADRQRLVNR